MRFFFFRLGLFLISVFALLDKSADAYIGLWFFFFLRIYRFALPSVVFFSLDWVCFTICCLGLMLGFLFKGVPNFA